MPKGIKGFQKGHKDFGGGVKFKKGQQVGEKNFRWKGDKVSKDGLHDWVYYHKGNPKKCEHCAKPNIKERGQWILDWANKSHEYKRDLNDWLALCLKCHRAYDKNFKNIY